MPQAGWECLRILPVRLCSGQIRSRGICGFCGFCGRFFVGSGFWGQKGGGQNRENRKEGVRWGPGIAIELPDRIEILRCAQDDKQGRAGWPGASRTLASNRQKPHGTAKYKRYKCRFLPLDSARGRNDRQRRARPLASPDRPFGKLPSAALRVYATLRQGRQECLSYQSNGNADSSPLPRLRSGQAWRARTRNDRPGPRRSRAGGGYGRGSRRRNPQGLKPRREGGLTSRADPSASLRARARPRRSLKANKKSF